MSTFTPMEEVLLNLAAPTIPIYMDCPDLVPMDEHGNTSLSPFWELRFGLAKLCLTRISCFIRMFVRTNPSLAFMLPQGILN